MMRQSLVAAAAALSLVAVPAYAAPLRTGSSVDASESVRAGPWILPAAAILFVALLIVIQDNGTDTPVSP